jgi:hypothetical protein
MQFNEQQQQFLGYAHTWLESTDLQDKCFVLSGYAGTGKTTVVAHFLKTQAVIPLSQILVCAPTHKAKQVLGDTLNNLDLYGFNLNSLHSALGLELQEDENTGRQKADSRKVELPPITKFKLVIIDECGMIGDDLWKAISQWLPLCKKILFLGDIYQLPPISSDSDKKSGNSIELSPVFSIPKIHYLTHVMRNNGTIGLYSEYSIHLIKQGSNGAELTNLPFLLDNIPRDPKNLAFVDNYREIDYFPELKFLASTNKKVSELNEYSRRQLSLSHESIAVGEELVFYSPYKTSGKTITNGTTGIVTEINPLLRLPYYCKGFNELNQEIVQSGITNGHYITLDIDGDCIELPYLPNRSVLVNELKKKASSKDTTWRNFYVNCSLIPDLSHTYALTIHKSQGSTYDYVILVDDTDWAKRFNTLMPRLHYVAVSRARKFVWITG